MLSALKKWWGNIYPVGQTSSVMEAGGVYAHLEDLEDADIPRYPPFAKGLPATPIDKLLATQRQLISKINYSLGFSQEEAQRLLYPVIRNYAAFVHLLPASEAHHHRGAGGLFRHGLEVAFWATQASEAIIFEPEGSPEEKIEKEPRWRFGVFLGALMHDLGKPLSDVVVTDKPGVVEWNPYAETLEEWLNESGVTHYFLRWNKGRHQRHERLATLALNMVMTSEVKRYLRLPGPELMKTLIEAISGTSAMHPMSKLIMLADAESVKRDLKESRLNIDGNSLGVSIEPYIIDAIRSLVQSGRWKCNQMDAQVWHASQGTFIAWKQAVPSLVQKLKDNSVPAVPHDADTLADYLIDRGFALPRPIPGREDEADENYYRYWEVTVSVEAEEGLTVEPKILMLRMEDAFLVFGNSTNPPEFIPAKVPGLDQEGQLVLQSTADAPQEDAEGDAEEVDEDTVTGEDGNTEQPPNSVRERLSNFKPVSGDAAEDAMAVLSRLSMGDKGADITPVEALEAVSSKRITDNTDITVGTDTPESIDATNPMAMFVPPRRTQSAPDIPKKPKQSETDIGALLASPGMAKASTLGPSETKAPNTDTSTSDDPFADLMKVSGMKSSGSQKTATPAKKPQKATETVTESTPALMAEPQAVVSKPRRNGQAHKATHPSLPVDTEKTAVDDHNAELEEVDVVSAFAEISNALGTDMGMDLPFDLPAPSTASTDGDDDGDDDGIEYETLKTSSEGEEREQESPPVSPPVAAVSAALDTPVTQVQAETPNPSTPEVVPAISETLPVELEPTVDTGIPSKPPAKKKKSKKRKSAAMTQVTKDDATPDMFATDIGSGAVGNTSADIKAHTTTGDDWLKSLTSGPKTKTKPVPSPSASTNAAFDFLLGGGAKPKGEAAKKTKPAPVSEAAPISAPATSNIETPRVPAAGQAEQAEFTHNANSDVEVATPFDIGMPDFEAPLDAPMGRAEPVQVEAEPRVEMVPEPALAEQAALSEAFIEGNDTSLHSHSELNSHSKLDSDASFPSEGPPSLELPPIESYGDMADSDEESTYAFMSIDAPGDAVVSEPLPSPTGDSADQDTANHYLTDMLAPILNGYGFLGQVLLREPSGDLVMLVAPAAQLLGVESTELVSTLVKGAAVIPVSSMFSAERLMFTPETARWIDQLLREREADRLQAMEQAETFGNEQPTSSLVRRKHRSKSDASVSVDQPSLASSPMGAPTPPAQDAERPSVLNAQNDDVDDREDDREDDDPDALGPVSNPQKSLTASEALVLLREMILAGEGDWLAGSVTKESDGYSTSDLCMEKVVAANPALTRRELRNSLKLRGDLKMNVVAEHNRLYVKD